MTIHRAVVFIAAFSLMAATPSAQRGRGGPVTPPRAGGLPAENAPRGTSIIRGVVLAADTGTPIRRAQVRASASGIRESRLATTDAQGRFEFKELAAGRYTLNASKGGFVSLQYGQRRPSESGTPLELGDGQVMDKLVVALPRGSVISGRVFDEFGEPVANAVVNAMRYGYSAGARRLLPGGGQNSRDTTDDQGQFRLFGLPPGEYVVSANFRGTGGEVTDPSGEPAGYAPTYFPGTANVADAQRVRVDISQEQTSVNFALIATQLVRVSGTIIDSKGAPVTSAAVMLMPGDTLRGAMQLPGGAARVDRTGGFRVSNVAPGRYTLVARTNLGAGGRGAVPAQSELARLDLVVGTDDLEGVVVITAPSARISGTIVSDTGQPLPIRPDQVQVTARSARPEQVGSTGPGGNARVGQDWSFTITGLFDPVFFRVSVPQSWSLRQVLLNGQDITDVPLEVPAAQALSGLQIVLTERITTLTGLITDAAGRPVTDASVVVFPAGEKLWYFQSRYIRAARPDQDGRYQIRGLPAYDDYLIALVQGLEDGQAGDPEFLSAIKATGSRLSLNEGESKAADVRLPVPR